MAVAEEMNVTEPEAEAGPREVQIGRRVVLGMLGLGGLGVLFGSKVQDLFERTVGRTPLSSVLPLSRFRIYTVTGGFPSRSEADYRLRVGGLVDQPMELTFTDLRAMAPTRLTKDFQCVTGWRVNDVKWVGVRLSDVMDRAGVKDGAWGVRFVSFDGVYTETLSMEQARRDDVIVAYEMQGGRISKAHGGPVRLYVAPMYGYKSAKWLSGIEVTDKVVEGYWERRGYDVDAWVGRSNGRDDEPVD